MKARWSAPALAHLVAIHEYISQQASPYVAERFLQRLITTVDPLEQFPQLGRKVPESGGAHRELGWRPYRIVDRAEGEEILVVAVIHGRRDFASALSGALEEFESKNATEPS